MSGNASIPSPRRRSRPVTAAVLALAAPLLAACADPAFLTGPGASRAGIAERPIPAPDRIQIDRVQLNHVVHFAPGSAGAAPGELARLEAFLDAVQPRPTDRLALAATAPAAAARLGVLQGALAAHGIAAVAAVPVAAGGDIGVVSFERAIALPAACLVDGGQAAPDGGVLPGLGCANALNLARMVADPADLLHGRTPGPADGAAAVLAIERYRSGQITPLVTETASGKVEGSSPGGAPPAPGGAGPGGAGLGGAAP